jgi:broad specificity phosphatase PhoE
LSSGAERPVLVIVKHAQPVLDASRPPREWQLGREGEEQARRLAERLRPFLPFRLVCSSEPKAVQTAAILSTELGVEAATVDDLKEIDRPALPILPVEEHRALNAGLFEAFETAVIGAESARDALDRFAAAIRRLTRAHPTESIVVVSHGTVMALFVAAANPEVKAYDLWERLQCASHVVLDHETFTVRETTAQV